LVASRGLPISVRKSARLSFISATAALIDCMKSAAEVTYAISPASLLSETKT
jgi:hypothetical protein